MTLTEEAGARAALEQLREVTGYVLARAAASGATGAAVAASVQQGLTVTVRMGEVETVEYSRDRGVGITVYHGQRKGSASTGDLQRASLDDSVDKACAIARFTEPDPCAGLPAPETLACPPVELDLWHPWDLAPEAAIELGQAIEAAAFAHDPLIRNSDGATASTSHAVSLYADSQGFVGERRSTRHALSCTVLAEDEHDKQRDYHYTIARRAVDLEDAERVGTEAARRAVARHGATGLATCTVPVLFTPEMARSLLGHFVAAVSGGNLYRGSSFLIDAAGEQLFPPFVTLEERPLEPRGLGSSWFDNEGVATRERRLIDAGTLTGYVLSTYSGRKLGLPTTGNAGGVHNLTVLPGSSAFDALVRQLDRGLIVTELMGQGVNLTTGDYSRGAAGFWVENGAIVRPVEGVTIAGQLREVFRGIVAVGSDVDRRGGIRTPSLLVERMTVAGT